MINDNFLSEQEFTNLYSMISSEDFPWFYIPIVADKNDHSDSYFIHTFYLNNKPNSGFYEFLEPFMKKLDIKALIRVRAIRYIGRDRLIEHGKHIDFPHSHKTTIFYLNTNNGFTRIGDKKKIKSVRNRAITIDGSNVHNSSNCTDADYRLVLTANYF